MVFNKKLADFNSLRAFLLYIKKYDIIKIKRIIFMDFETEILKLNLSEAYYLVIGIHDGWIKFDKIYYILRQVIII